MEEEEEDENTTKVGGGEVIVQAAHASLIFLTEVNQLAYQDLTKQQCINQFIPILC